jgi:hypothetical protein
MHSYATKDFQRRINRWPDLANAEMVPRRPWADRFKPSGEAALELCVDAELPDAPDSPQWEHLSSLLRQLFGGDAAHAPATAGAAEEFAALRQRVLAHALAPPVVRTVAEAEEEDYLEARDWGSLIEGYTRFHKRALSGTSANQRFIVYSPHKVKGFPVGWGNHVMWMVRCLYFALMSKRVMLFRFGPYETYRQFLGTPPFEWDFDAAALSSPYLRSQAWKSNESYVEIFYETLGIYDPHEFINVTSEIDVFGELWTFPYMLNFERLFGAYSSNLLMGRPTAALLWPSEFLQERLQLGLLTDRYVIGIQVRLGGMAGDTFEFPPQNEQNLPLFFKCAQEIGEGTDAYAHTLKPRRAPPRSSSTSHAYS